MMDPTEILVVAIAVVLMGLVLWYFFPRERRPKS